MAFKLKIKTGIINPASGALDTGELGYNYVDKRLFVGNFEQLPTPIAALNDIGNGELLLGISSESALSGSVLQISNGNGFTANINEDINYDIKIGPAFTNLATLMNNNFTGFIRKLGQDTFVLDTNAGTLYSIKASSTPGGAGIDLDSTNSITDTVKLVGSGSVSINRTDADTITISAIDTNTATHASGIMFGDNIGTLVSYQPFSAETANTSWVSNAINSGKLYFGNNAPIGATRLNYNGELFATKFSAQQLILTQTQGTAPIQVSSNTLVDNLNADLLDGQEGSYYLDASNIDSGTLGIYYGGTGSNNKTDAFNNLSPLTTIGDLLYHDGLNNIRLPKGNSGQLLTSSENGVGWQDLNLSELVSGASIVVSNEAPQLAKDGDFWWDSSTSAGTLFVYYEDGDPVSPDNSGQWVQAGFGYVNNQIVDFLSLESSIFPKTNIAYDIGSIDKRFNNLYSGTAVHIGNIVLKDAAGSLGIYLADGVTPAPLANIDALVYKGALDASTNPNYPAGDIGHMYKISIDGRIGGPSGPLVYAGDMIICNVSNSPAGDHQTVGSNWDLIQTNLDGIVFGPASSAVGAIPFWDVATGTSLSAGYAISGTGNVAMTTSPIFTTPSLGNATATTINNLTITPIDNGSTLTISNTKNFIVNKSLTLDGNDNKTLTLNKSLTLDGNDDKTLTLNNSISISGTDNKTLTLNNSIGFSGNDNSVLTLNNNATINTNSILLSSGKTITAQFANLVVGDTFGTGTVTVKSDSGLARTLTLNSNSTINPLSAGQILYASSANTISGEDSLGIVRGGTGISTYTPGDILYSDSENQLTKLPVGQNGQVMIVNNNRPSWQNNNFDTSEVEAFAVAMAIALG
jgi:hypothetical protein